MGIRKILTNEKRKMKLKINKRFHCKSCGYLSPAGYLVNVCDCPECKTPMKMGFYRQYKNHCKPIEEKNERKTQ